MIRFFCRGTFLSFFNSFLHTCSVWISELFPPFGFCALLPIPIFLGYWYQSQASSGPDHRLCHLQLVHLSGLSFIHFFKEERGSLLAGWWWSLRKCVFHGWHMAGTLMVTKRVSACFATGVSLVLELSRCLRMGYLTLQVGDLHSW